MNEEIKLLDHGYLKLVETWGSDESIIEAARMSTGKGFLGWGPICDECKLFVGSESGYTIGAVCPRCQTGKMITGDEKLLKFLYENNHHTPFEMGGLTIEVQAPIMVFREWHRHRVPFSYNELSARYTPLPDVNYIPTVERCMINSKTNKQAGVIAGADELTESVAAELMEEERLFNEAAERFYQKKLKAGVPKELARTHIGVSRYSRMRASSNVRGWINFLKLRMAPNAQYEIRMYANAVGVLLSQSFPRTWELFAQGKT